MSHRQNFHRSLLLVALLAIPLVNAQAAAPAMPPMGAPALQAEQAHPGMPPFLHGVQLSEAQQDQLFQIHHQQASALYAQHKAARKAHEALRALSLTPEYTPERARELARSAAEAEAEIALLHARAAQQTLALLSAEQRLALAAGKPRQPMNEAPPAPPRGRAERP